MGIWSVSAMIECKIFSGSLTKAKCLNCYWFKIVPSLRLYLVFFKKNLFLSLGVVRNWKEIESATINIGLLKIFMVDDAEETLQIHIKSEDTFMTKTFRRGHLKQYRQSRFKFFSLIAPSKVRRCFFIGTGVRSCNLAKNIYWRCK